MTAARPETGPDRAGRGTPVLSLSGLRKSYGGAPALTDAALDLHAGEVHALMGENGAGKSTLIRILAGVTRADAMELAIDGRPAALASPADADRLGLRFVHQELNVVPALTVAENVLLAHALPRRFGALIDWQALHATAAAALARFGATWIDPRTRLARLGTGDQMLVRLAALVAGDPAAARIFVLDEPTAALTQAEAARLFAVLHDLRRAGAAILYVSHRLDEVMALADRVTVLRDGQGVLSAPVTETGRTAIIEAMTGAEATAPVPRAAAAVRPAARDPALVALRDLRTERLSGLTLDLAPGETVGLAGLEGAGQEDFLRLFLGFGRVLSGSLAFAGGPAPRNPPEAWARGIAYLPRERRRQGLMLRRSVTANMTLPHLGRLGRLGLFASAPAERAAAGTMAATVRLKAPGLGAPVGRLSGGNQQKVLLARAILGAPRLLLLDDPTRGVDVAARADIHALIRDRAAQGTAVLVASTDLDELIDLADRILILRGGAQAGLVPARGLDPAGLLDLVYGAAGGRAA